MDHQDKNEIDGDSTTSAAQEEQTVEKSSGTSENDNLSNESVNPARKSEQTDEKLINNEDDKQVTDEENSSTPTQYDEQPVEQLAFALEFDQVTDKEINSAAAQDQQVGEQPAIDSEFDQQKEKLRNASHQSAESLKNQNDALLASSSALTSRDSSSTFPNMDPSSLQAIISMNQQGRSGDCGPWRQVAYRRETSLSGPPVLDKVKTQYDHVLWISEKEYVEKSLAEWMHVPMDGGALDCKIRLILQAIVQLEDILNSPITTWDDYFNMKKYLQTLIDVIVAEANALRGQAGQARSQSAMVSSLSSTGNVNDEKQQENNEKEETAKPNSEN
ncbi:unnamed protein product [Gongylonema pulchrum]|uniref:Uncharacterized protein n=1 Tax=Gongylonema pulchrum TaxID=637853 RepID=A0A3P7MTY7_9BILA|nr:unnamed protein product [Gongylonema pulchrum]